MHRCIFSGSLWWVEVWVKFCSKQSSKGLCRKVISWSWRSADLKVKPKRFTCNTYTSLRMYIYAYTLMFCPDYLSKVYGRGGAGGLQTEANCRKCIGGRLLAGGWQTDWLQQVRRPGQAHCMLLDRWQRGRATESLTACPQWPGWLQAASRWQRGAGWAMARFAANRDSLSAWRQTACPKSLQVRLTSGAAQKVWNIKDTQKD